MDSKQDPSLLQSPHTAPPTNSDPHDTTQNIPDAAYPESSYRPGTGYSSNASQTHLNPQPATSPIHASASSPTHLQPRQWPVGGGAGAAAAAAAAGPSNVPLEPPPPYEPPQTSPTQAAQPGGGPSWYAPPSVPQPAQQHPQQQQYLHPQNPQQGESIPMSNLSTTGVYGQDLAMSPPPPQQQQQQQPSGGSGPNGVAAAPVAGVQNGAGKVGDGGRRKGRGKRRIRICVFIVIAVIVLIIALIVGVALGVLRSKLGD